MPAAVPPPNWLISRVSLPVTVKVTQDSTSGASLLVMGNGLIQRTILLGPNAATVSFLNLRNRQEFIRATEPEALITLNGNQVPIGGLTGQPDRGFLLPQWYSHLTGISGAFQYAGYHTGPITAPFPWKAARQSNGQWGGKGLNWPPKGLQIDLNFTAPAGTYEGMAATVRYQIYQGMPVMMKQLIFYNRGKATVRVDSWAVERMAFAENESVVGSAKRWRLPDLFLTSDYSFAGDNAENSNQVERLLPDPTYDTQVNYDLQTPALLECRPPLGPGIDLKPGEDLASFRVYEMPYDSTDREARGLEQREFYTHLAPWSQENPLMFHLVASDTKTVKEGIDQAAATGFEVVILSFGSGLNMEDVSPENIAKFKALADYAHSKGIALGGYSLLASRSIDAADDVIDPKTGKPGGAVFGSSPCLGSKWGIAYLEHIKTFLSETGFDLLENDGSYPGDVCASTTHPGHRDLEDSQWTQWKQITDFYEWCRGRGIFLNVPDWYFLAGSNKSGMGYRETNWSLPRALQHIHNRQDLYDGTWGKTPSMGWTFVPLTEYHGGGAAATIEPLKDHLAHYSEFFAENLGYGAQACYRGLRLYDSPETLKMVKGWVTWFKAHRAILQSNVIHLGRPNGRELDAVLHVNPLLKERALLMVFNPTEKALTQTWLIPLHYAGLARTCFVISAGGRRQQVQLNEGQEATVRVRVPAQGHVWMTFEAG